MSRYLAITVALLFFVSGGPALGFSPTLVEDTDQAWRSVQGGANGNPVVYFNGDLSGGKVTSERFVNVPRWIVSEDFDKDGTYDAAVMFSDGTLRIVSLSKGRFRTMATARKMAPAVPPVVLDTLGGESTGGLVGVNDKGNLVSVDHETGRTRQLAGGFSTLSHIAAGDFDKDGNNEIAAVNEEGSMTLVRNRTQSRSDKSAQLLPDTRISVADLDGDGTQEILAFSRPTQDISPGRLGDDLEAQGLAVFNWDGNTIRLRTDFELSDDEIFEALVPIVVDGGSDEGPLLMIPVTDGNQGTQIRSYSYSGVRIREKRRGPVSDEDQRIQVLGSSTMGNESRVYLITSLIAEDDEGDLELYRLDLAQRRITLNSSVGTHFSGSRLVETVLIGDMNRDGEVDLLAPGDGSSSLSVYSLDRSVLKGTEIFNSSRKVGTNLCPGDFNGDGISDIMFGLDDGTLVVILGE